MAQGYAAASEIVSAAAQVTGGTYGLVEGAIHGDPAGILGGALEVAGGTAAGLAPVQGITSAAAESEDGVSGEVFNTLQQGLAAAGALTSFGASVSRGDLTSGLLNSLLPWLSSLAAQNVADKTLDPQFPGGETDLILSFNSDNTPVISVAYNQRTILTLQFFRRWLLPTINRANLMRTPINLMIF